MGSLCGFTRFVTSVLTLRLTLEITLGLTLEITLEFALSGDLGWPCVAVDAPDDLLLELRDGHGLGNFVALGYRERGIW